LQRILYTLLFFTSLIQADRNEYNLGEGYKVASLPLYIGGYFSTDFQHIPERNLNRFRLDDIALLGYGSMNKFSYMAEFEFKQFYINEWGGYSKHSLNKHLNTERLYVAYDYNENVALRLGKFNSPIGYWNMIPINVLRDTTSNPNINLSIYPKYTTGLDASLSSYTDSQVKLDIIIQNNKDIDDNYNNIKIDKHYAMGLEYTQDDVSFKFNAGYFHTKQALAFSSNIYYTLASFKYTNELLKFMGEIGTQFTKDRSLVPYDAYMQVAYQFAQEHVGILRYESYDNRSLHFTQKDNIMVMAYTYRPIYPIALKAEYQFHEYDKQDKFLCSFSVMF